MAEDDNPSSAEGPLAARTHCQCAAFQSCASLFAERRRKHGRGHSRPHCNADHQARHCNALRSSSMAQISAGAEENAAAGSNNNVVPMPPPLPVMDVPMEPQAPGASSHPPSINAGRSNDGDPSNSAMMADVDDLPGDSPLRPRADWDLPAQCSQPSLLTCIQHAERAAEENKAPTPPHPSSHQKAPTWNVSTMVPEAAVLHPNEGSGDGSVKTFSFLSNLDPSGRKTPPRLK